MANQTLDTKMRHLVVRAAMPMCGPQSVDEMLVLADAIRVYSENPELRSPHLANLDKPMMAYFTRIAMAGVMAGVMAGADLSKAAKKPKAKKPAKRKSGDKR
jgi:hypothetical protein